MAQQDEIIEIKELERISTSVLEYFYNIALVTEISDEDLVDAEGNPFDPSGKETFKSLPAVESKFKTTSRIFKIARNIFTQKTNTGVNQSGLRQLVILKKEESDETFEDCLTRLGYRNSYFVLINKKTDQDIKSAGKWVGGYRKLLFAQTNSANVKSSATDDIATDLKKSGVRRTALYYHANEDESLCGAMASILASSPIGGRNASYKKPSDIIVDELGDTEEVNLMDKNVNFYVYYIGSAGDYGKRNLTSHNGVLSNGEEIQKQISIDRTVLSLQASLMDALEQDIPYDDNGGTIIYDKVNSVYAQLKREHIFAEDSVDEETGEMIKSYTIHVLPRATVKKYYPEQFAKKEFIVETEVEFAGSGKRVALTIAY